MRRRSQLLRLAKWGGVVIGLLLTALWFVTMNWRLYAFSPTTGVLISEHKIRLWRLGMPAVSIWPDGRTDCLRWGWGIRSARTREITVRFMLQGDGRAPREVPLWLPLGIVSLCTAAGFWIDRRRPLPGHCPCGDDLIAPGKAWERRRRCRS